MPKRIILKNLVLILVLGLFFGFTVSFCFADESITVTTYYPSPYGSYNELKTNYLQFEKISVPPTQNDTCLSEEEGKISYNSKEKMLYLCIGNYWVRLVRDFSQKEIENRVLGKPAPFSSNISRLIPASKSVKKELNSGALNVDEHNYDAAILEFTKAIKLDPNYSDGYKNRAVIYYFKQEYAKAWDDVHRAQKLGAIISQRFLEDLKKASNIKK